MKKILFSILFIFFALGLSAQSTLIEGDIAIIAYDTPTDDFAFVTLVELEAGTEIYFTDEEADNDFTISLNEGHLLYTAPAVVTAGTVIQYSTNTADFTTASASFAPGNSGDGLIAYQGSSVGQVTTFLHAVGEDAGDIGTIPNGFMSFILYGSDDGEYNDLRTGLKADLFTLINDSTNWTTSGSSIAPIDITSFVVTVNMGNNGPSITNIQRTPNTNTVALNTQVSVSSDISDPDLDMIGNVDLDWSFENLSNVITTGTVSMLESTTTAGQWIGNIPGQSEDGTMSLSITATDINAAPESSTSSTLTYIIQAPQPQGLQIDTADTLYTIDFDNTVANVNNGAYAGTGFAVIPAAGQLDANAFAINGLQDGTTNFGDEQSGNDFGKGISTGGESSGGIYSFEVETGNFALGFQPTGGDLTPGTIFFQFTNNTGSIINKVAISYELYILNNENRANDFIFSHGSNISSLTEVTASELSSEIGSDSSPEWVRNFVNIDLNSLSIADGDTYVIAWTTTDSGSGSSDELALDNIQILANPISQSISLQGEVAQVKILGDASVNSATEITNSLDLLEGTLVTNDNLTLKSSNGTSAEVGPVLNGDVIGDVIVEQFYPARRAFRFVSSPVTTTGTIFSDWQQGGLNPMDPGYVAGNGTHVTGGTTGGFDTTTSNNPSIFGWSNDNSQSWTTLSATDDPVANLQAGAPYRLFIRGDRSVDLTDNNATATDTKLITTGELVLNTSTQTFATNLVDGDFVFAGNPYQSKVDISLLMNNAVSREDINPNFMYVWNPQASTRGAYRVFDFTDSSSTPVDSEVNGVLQPGQAMFLQVLNDGDADDPSITFEESYKTTGSNLTATYSIPEASLSLNISKTNNSLDGVKINFSTQGNNGFDANDLNKLFNPDENISITNGVNHFAIESRDLPVDGDIIPLSLSGLSTGTYNFDLGFNGTLGLNIYLFDAFTNQYTLISNGINNLAISFDENIIASMDTSRLSLVFSNSTLSFDENAFAEAITIYPNPVKNSILNVTGFTDNAAVDIILYNMSGQVIYTDNKELQNTGDVKINLDNINMGVYLLSIKQNQFTMVKEVIISE